MSVVQSRLGGGVTLGIPKPIKRSTQKRKDDAVDAANTSDVRAEVFERESHCCRIPWCRTALNLEFVHLKAKGMGGNPTMSRTTRQLTICGCNRCHQGVRSLHTGHIKWRFLSDAGADGPMAFEWCERLPKAEMGIWVK